METTQLKTCPFCGHVPKIVTRGCRGYAVICSNFKCPAQPEVSPPGGESWCREKAVAVWNRRFPGPKTGEWGFVHYDYAVCSNCGGEHYAPFETTHEACEHWDELPPFCPNCGAEMERKKLLKKWAAIERRNKRNAEKMRQICGKAGKNGH